VSGITGAYCSAGQIEDMQISIEGIFNQVSLLKSRVDQLERDNERLEAVISGSMSLTAERAAKLSEVVRTKGFLSRGEVMRIFECHHKVALEAMQKATEMFDDLYVTKSAKNQWVLAVKE